MNSGSSSYVQGDEGVLVPQRSSEIDRSEDQEVSCQLRRYGRSQVEGEKKKKESVSINESRLSDARETFVLKDCDSLIMMRCGASKYSRNVLSLRDCATKAAMKKKKNKKWYAHHSYADLCEPLVSFKRAVLSAILRISYDRFGGEPSNPSSDNTTWLQFSFVIDHII